MIMNKIKSIIKWMFITLLNVFYLFLHPSVGSQRYKTNCESFMNIEKLDIFKIDFKAELNILETKTNWLGYYFDYQSCTWKVWLVILYDGKKSKNNLIQFIWIWKVFYGIPYALETMYINNNNLNKFSPAYYWWY